MTRWSLFLQTLSLLHHFLGLYFGFVRNHVHLTSDYLTAFREAGLNVVQCIEPLWGDREVATMGFAEQMPDLMEAAVKGIPIVIAWELGEECLTPQQARKVSGRYNGNRRPVIRPEGGLSYQEETEWRERRTCQRETPIESADTYSGRWRWHGVRVLQS